MCHAATGPSALPGQEQEEPQISFGGPREELERRTMAEAIPRDHREKGHGRGEKSVQELEAGDGEGTLVLHVRSGDIFDNKVLAYYGQVICCNTQFLAFYEAQYLARASSVYCETRRGA